MSTVLSLWEYNRTLRHRFFDTFAKIPWDELVKNREASFYSIRNIFLHILNAEDWWLHTVVPNKGAKFTPYDFNQFTSVESVRKQMETVEAKTQKLLQHIDQEKMKHILEYTRPDGSTYKNSLEGILAHLVLEETHHRGELIALFWQMNVEPPHIGLVQFLQNTKPGDFR